MISLVPSHRNGRARRWFSPTLLIGYQLLGGDSEVVSVEEELFVSCATDHDFGQLMGSRGQFVEWGNVLQYGDH